MKTLVAATALAVGMASTAFAGTPLAPIAADPIVVAPAPVAPEWGGFYAGGSYSFFSAAQTFQGQIDSQLIGAFAGYNFQSGNFVFGGELAYSAGSYAVGPFSGDIDAYDLKARAGYSAGNALLYVVGGWTMAQIATGGIVADFEGFNYGAGMQIKLGKNAFAGIEYLIHDLDGLAPFAVGETITSNSITIRFGWQF